MSISKRYFGKTPEGIGIDIFTLTNKKSLSAEITNFGGVIISLLLPDIRGKIDDCLLGFDKLEDYCRQGPYFGAIIGRHANRIENASFEINGVEYHLNKNLGEDHLHGGLKGFDKIVWQAEIIMQEDKECLQLKYTSKDGEENYPGELEVKVVYSLTEDNALEIHYFAVSDRDTVVNLTNHAYFNLAGHASGDVLKHKLMINADKFTVIDKKCMPTGEIRDVKNTPMDFRRLKPIEQNLSLNDEQIICGNGYDHNWILNVSGEKPEKAAELYDEVSGRVMEIYTSKPGMQFFTPDFANYSEIGKGGVIYNKRNGVCFETQYFPNALKYRHFPSPIIKAGQIYKHTTIFKFPPPKNRNEIV